MNHKGFVFVFLVLATWLLPATSYAAQTAPSAFAEAACETVIPDVVFPDRTVDVTCGYLTVPELHSQPDGKTIQLAVMIAHSTSPSPAADPLVMMQGGPGGSTLDTYAELVLKPEFTLRNNRDIVLFDQRGTLYSKPNLICSEEITLLQQTIEQDLSREESDKRGLQTLQQCRERLTSEGVNIAAYNSVENAADVDDLRVALGYEQINLYGVSYGTLLAQHVMRDHPDGIRSVILDAVAPAAINFVTEVPRSQERAFRELFAACAADTTCQRDYPNLEQTFNQQIERLNKTPVQIPVTDRDTGTTYDAVFNGDAFRDGVFQMLYATEILPLLPGAIENASHNKFDLFSVVMPIFLFDRTGSTGMYFSVMCAEDADFTPADVAVDGVRQELAKDADADATSFLAVCQSWNAPELGPSVDAPVQSDIPTLLLSGRFDPITPPAFASSVAEQLPNSTNVLFPNTGHGALNSEACAMAIAGEFLDAPTAKPDVTCVDTLSAPDFADTSNIVPGNAGLRIIDWLNLQNMGSFYAMVAPLVVMLSLLLVWPLIWLIRLIQRHTVPNSPFARIAALAGFLVLVLGLVLLIGLVVLMVTDSDNTLTVTLGFPRTWMPVLITGPIVVLLLLIMLGGTVQLWVRRLWSVGERVYFTLLTVMALIFVAMLVFNGLIINPFG